MSRKLSFLLAILVVVCMVGNVAFAESWTCPECGTVNDGNFCSNCGTKKPETNATNTSTTTSTITNVTFSPQSNGDILVEWNDSSSASSYTVAYTTEYWNSTYGSDSITGKRVLLEYLIPGVTYYVYVSNGVSDTTLTYTVPKPIYTEYSTGGKYLNLTMEKFSLSEMEKKPTMTFEVQVSWPRLKNSREYAAKLVLNTPYGYASRVIYYDVFTFENKYEYTYVTFSLMNDWLVQVEEDFGSIPTGEYTFEIYMDGQLYDYASFKLSN